MQHQQILTDCHARRCSSGLIVDADATCKVIGDAVIVFECTQERIRGQAALLLLVFWLMSKLAEH